MRTRRFKSNDLNCHNSKNSKDKGMINEGIAERRMKHAIEKEEWEEDALGVVSSAGYNNNVIISTLYGNIGERGEGGG